MITIRTLGPVEVLRDGEPAPSRLQWKKNVALLVYLARSPARTRTREHLVGVLWADKPEKDARHSLRESIRVLRREIDEGALTTEHDRVTLDPGAVALDVDRLEALRTAGEWTAAAELAAGTFLEGFAIPDAPAFEDWLAAERMLWHARSVETLVRCAEDQLAGGKTAQAVDSGLRAVALDPSSGSAARAAMRALAVAGDRAAALDCYARLGEALAAVGAAPDADTEAMAERVRRERVWHLPASVPGSHAGAESRRMPLVGRERELARLTTAWQECREGRRAGAAIVAGAPGVGKSRLAEELLARARLDGAATAVVRCVPADRGAACAGALGLARGGLIDAPGVAAATAGALAAFAAAIPEWADRFRATSPAPLTPDAALRDVVRAVAEETPVLLLVDDAQWLDGASLGALAAVVRDAADAPVLVTFAVSPHPEQPDLDDLRSRIGRDVPGAAVELAPLDAASLDPLVSWALPAYGPADRDRMARRLAADSAGLPLLAVELLHAVALGLDLGTVTGVWPQPDKTLDHTLPTELPDAVVAAIRVGFRRLSAEAQRLLAGAAVLGDRVEPGRLGRAVGVADDRLVEALDELEWQRWLAADPLGYSFVARIVRDVVERDMVTAGQRQRILAAAS